MGDYWLGCARLLWARHNWKRTSKAALKHPFAPSDQPIMIPLATVARVFHDVAFKNDDTRVTAPTVAVSAEYIRLFVREAVLRANAQREAEGVATAGDGIDNISEAVEPDLGTQFVDDSERPDSDLDDADEARGLGVATQAPPDELNETLVTRHLAAVSGLLVMDF